MAFDFPNSPLPNQQFTPPVAGAPTYIFSGGVWKLVGGIGAPGNLSVSDNPPPSPVAGQMWLESDTGNLFAYWADADSSQWVQINVPNVSGIGASDYRNRLVNGSMLIGQEVVFATAANGNNVWVCDQWVQLANLTATTASCVRTQDSAAAAMNGNKYVYYQSVNTAKASIPATEYLQFSQPLEGTRMADLQWGTASARPLVLRCTIKNTIPGLYTVCVTNAANDRSYLKGINLTASYQTIILKIPGCTTGTWPDDTSLWGSVRFVAAAGSSVIGVDGAWQSSNAIAVPGQANGCSVGSQGFGFTDVGLYLDDGSGIPPRFELPDIGPELNACKRYWQYYNVNKQPIGSSVYAGGSWLLPITMRTNPVSSYLDLSGNSGKVTTGSGANVTFGGSIGPINPSAIYADGTLPASQTYWWGFQLYLNARM